jgi:tRNA (mo5U34)-methyltransferase
MPDPITSASSDQSAAEALRARVAQVPYWYHRIELPHGVVTPGWSPWQPERYRIPDDFTGKRVLDVGAWNGYWTFQALKRGAREVLAIDDFSDTMGYLDPGQRQGWEPFDLCREALGYDETRCQRREISIYEINPEEHGQFDIIFLFGTFYHLRHPLLALELLADICTDEIYVESAILDDYSPYRGGLGHGYPNQMLMEFYPTNEYGNNPGNWWVPTLKCLANMLGAAGWPAVDTWKLDEVPTDIRYCRGFARGSKKPK